MPPWSWVGRLEGDLQYGLDKYTNATAARFAEEAVRVAVGRARSAWRLRGAASVGYGTITLGRVNLINEGTVLIGEYCRFDGRRASIEIGAAAGARAVVGDSVKVNYGVTISTAQSITIGDRVQMGPYATVADTGFHGVIDRNNPGDPAPVTLEEDVWLGAFTLVSPGVTVGRAAVVGAHAVVTHDVEPFTVVAGVPARVIRRVPRTAFVPDRTPASQSQLGDESRTVRASRS